MAETSASAIMPGSSGGDLAGAKLPGGGGIGEWAVQGRCWGSEGARLVGRGAIPNPTSCRPGFPARQGGKCHRPFWPDSAWALQQVSGYPGYTGRDANIVAQAARDLKRTFDMARGETRSTYAHRVGSLRAGGIGRDFTFSHAPLRQANSASSWSIRDSPSLSVTSSITRSLSWTIR